MSSAWKMSLWFLAGAASGAAGLAYLNRSKMDFSYMKPVCENILAKGMDITDRAMAKFAEAKENLEDMTMAARDRVDAERMAKMENCENIKSQNNSDETC